MNAVSKQELAKRFSEGYERLNPAQKKAVDTIEGPVMVIAGPGTGKTQILTLRIANILHKTDTSPSSILALTFTESGVVAMRERLTRYVGPLAYEIPIFTFHGFCVELIRRFPDAYQTIIGSAPASDLDTIGIVETILDNATIKLLRPTGDASYYLAKIKNQIATLKREYIAPDDLRAIIAVQESTLAGIERYHLKGPHKGKERGEYKEQQKIIEKNLELLFVYRDYEAMLRERRLHDFEDMIVETVKVLTASEEVRLAVQEQYQYVVADEHQDVNGSQNRILELLCNYHDRPNIFVVGDEKQAIYRFQGASLENFLYFEDIFPHTTTISLTDNYRSGQVILDVAQSLITVNEGPLKALRTPLVSQQKFTGSVSVAAYTHQAVEDFGLVHMIKAQLEAGVPPKEIAVITRSNKEVERIANVLHNAGIAVEATSESDVLTHPVTKHVLALIDAVVNPEDQSALFTLLHGAYWQILPADFVKIASAQSYERSLSTLVYDAAALATLSLHAPEQIAKVAQVLSKARNATLTKSPQLVLQALLTESGFLEYVTASDPLTGGRVIRRIYDEVERLVLHNAAATLADIATLFARLTSHNIALTAPYVATGKDAVAVMTAHKSKGLEFEQVFIPGFDDRTWGKKQQRVSFTVPITKHTHDEYDELDDERRLLYVALTRAKQSVVLSYAANNREGKELVPSRFLSELDAAILSTADTEAIEQAFSPTTTLVQQQTTTHGIDASLLRTLFYERGFSATSFNNYYESPWQYFYRNILRIPEVQALPMRFGTAIHSVLEQVAKRYGVEKVAPKDTEIISMLDAALRRLPLSTTEFVRLKEKGINMLMAYIPVMLTTLSTSKEEVPVRAFLETGDATLPPIPLRGNFDRIDIAPDGSYACVVDYKTGSPKSRNDIEKGDYKRQLTFYALLLSLQPEPFMQTRTMKLSFVEPTKGGNIKEETFIITDEEIESLKVDIIQAARAVVSGEFLGIPYEPSKEKGGHDYSHLIQAMFPRD